MQSNPDDARQHCAGDAASSEEPKELPTLIGEMPKEDMLALANLLAQGELMQGDHTPPPANPAEDLAQMMTQAADPNYVSTNPHERFFALSFTDSVAILGGPAIIGTAIKSHADLLAAINRGFPSAVLSELRRVGIPDRVLANNIAPQRTLNRRMIMNQRLSRRESDAAWRLASGMATACKILGGPAAALSWLGQPKGIFRNLSGFDLLETSVGEASVKEILYILAWGDIA